MKRIARLVSSLALALPLAASLVGCSHQYDGPAPTLSALAPEAACNDQIATTIAISGAGLSPLTTGIQGAPLVELPQLTLLRDKDIDGNIVEASDPNNTVLVPNDPAHPETASETWTDQGNMSLFVCPLGTCSKATPARTDYPMLPGLYTLKAQNRNGKETLFPAAITIVPVPTVRMVSPDLLCKDKDNEVLFEGDFLLRFTGRDGKTEMSKVTIGGKEFAPKEMSDCRALPSPSGIKIEACKKVSVAIPAKTFETGQVTTTITGPAPVPCHSTETITIAFVPEPTVEKVIPDIVCLDDHEQTVTVQGKDFLSVDGMLPKVILSGMQTFDAVDVADCVPLPPGTREQVQVCKTLHFHLTQGSVKVGIYNVVVQNPPPADCTSKQMVDLTVVPRPTLSAIVPDMTCNHQRKEIVILQGSDFLTIDGVLPTVDVGGVLPTDIVASDCVPLPGPTEKVEKCSTLTVTLPQMTLSPGNKAVVVTNPPPANCVSTPPVDLTDVPEPTLNTLDIDVVCLDDHGQNVTVNGTDFLSIDGKLPQIIITPVGGGMPTTLTAQAAANCQALIGPKEQVQSCNTLTMNLTQGLLPVGQYNVVVKNPGPPDCVTTQPITLTVVPKPTVKSVVADTICLAAGDVGVTVNGSGFLRITVGQVVKLPGVAIGMLNLQAIAAQGCTVIPGTINEKLETCTALTVAVPKNALPPGSYPVVVTNPLPAGCMSTDKVSLAVLPAPTVSSVTPDLTCNAQQASVFVLAGSNFYQINGTNPTVQATQNGQPIATVTAQMGNMGCQTVQLPSGQALSCPTIVATFPAGTLGSSQAYQFIITNPAPAACASAGVTVVVAAPPKLTSAMPPAICSAQGPVPVKLLGEGLFNIDGKVPTARFASNQNTFTVGNGATAQCMNFPGIKEVASVCGELDVTVPQNSIAPGVTYDVSVTNPSPLDTCTSQQSIQIVGTPPPVITAVGTNPPSNPPKICVGGGVVTVTGLNFEQGAVVTLSGAPMGTATASQVTVTNGTAISAVFDKGLKAGGPYDLTVKNPSGCQATFPAAVGITPGPIVFFVDPPIVWNGLTTQVTVYGANVVPPIKTVNLVPTGQQMPVTPLVFTADPKNPQRAKATIPKGLAAGTYDLQLADQTTCPAILVAALKVVQQVSFTFTVSPSFGYQSASTAVTLGSMGAFRSTPRAYVNSGGNALALRSVAFVDSNRLTAVVPPLGAPGKYDLIIVNPDGTVGVLAGGFTATATPPPTITTLNPGVVSTQGGQSFSVVGQSFDANAKVSLTCYDQNSLPVAAPNITQGALSMNCNNLGPNCFTVTGTFSTAGFCVVRVTNPDTSWFEFSSLVINNPALKLGNFTAGTAMTTGRRGLALVSANATATARYLYAIGGDSGTEAGALNSVEATTVDTIGKLGSSWFVLPNRMTKPHGYVGAATVGRAIYAVGGSDGTGAQKVVERAFVLDPLTVPTLADIDIYPSDGQSGLKGGLWYYRVAAIMANNDPFNPNGETLASDEFIIQTPNLPDLVKVTLTWNALPNAKAYRVYRNAAAPGASGAEVLVADNVMGTQWIDAGAVALSQAKPLPLGATGVWVPIAPLNTARSGAAVVAAPDVSKPGTFYLYAMGGNSGTAASPVQLRSYELLPIVVDANTGAHATPMTWTQPVGTMNTPKWQTGGFTLLSGGNAWVWAGAGYTTGQVLTQNVDGASVTPGTGVLSAFTTLGKQMGNRGGYAAVAVNNFLFAFGGAGGQPDTTAVQGQLGTVPEVTNWPTSTSLSTPRYLTSGTVLSGFIFVAGGQTNQVAASNSIESTIW